MPSRYTKKQISKTKKIMMLIALILLVLFYSGFILVSQIKTVYQVTFNGTPIGDASSPEIVFQWIGEQVNRFEGQYPGVLYETNESAISFTETKRLNAKARDSEVIASLQSSYEIKGRGVQVLVDGQVMGIVRDQHSADQILNQIQQPYSGANNDPKVKTLSYNNDEREKEAMSPSVPSSISFVEKVEIKPVVADPVNFSSEEELIKRLKGTDLKPIKYVVKEGDCISCIAQKFNISQDTVYKNNPWIENEFINIGDELDLTVRQPKLSVKTEGQYAETVSIPSGVEVTYDATMRVGVSKVANPGKAGKKKLTYQVTKVNGELVEEVVIKEETLEKAVPKQVIQGTKVIKGVGTGSFTWPIKGPTITSKFGKRWGRLHTGTDAVSSNLNIKSADNGKVIKAKYDSSYGNHVIVDHQNGYRTLYAHLSKINVEVGDLLEKGDQIGIMGTTGRSTGVHLHFEIRKEGVQLNPLKFLE
ncbi:LysM peptidoglycan-binding domain-containing M23 family metallopeptidase [Paenibacillus agaridevorans]|uniref:LysM peptidoglycan-binding domain-containing M23 family metallopeptidase n=1 Tax=Paenibacillus agaridevorans TaxID=171404 RepID=UPI001BE4C2B2|nr:peptidoglycan DD-metalloendopeptidase family protein [Paenibacillus agaridevorans]